MKRIISLFIVLLLVGILYISCAQEAEKMPITTSSTEALELFKKGRSLTDRIRTIEAANYFEKAVALDSNFALAWLQLAFTSSSNKQFMDYFEKAKSLIDSVSEGEKIWILSVEAGNINNDAEQMFDYLNRLVEMYPEDERVHNLLGNAYFGSAQFSEAIPMYKKAIELNPEFSPVYNQLGYIYRYLKNYTEAEKMFKKYIELIPNDPNPYDSYAELLLEMGEFDRSIENYKKALSINPYFYFSHVGIATNLNLKGEHVAARAQLQELYRTAKRPDQRRLALFGTAVSYIDEGNYNLALKELYKRLEIAKEIDDQSTIANDLVLIGIVNYMNQEYDRALELIKESRALVQNSDLPDNIKRNSRNQTNFNLTMVYARTGQIDSATVYKDTYLAYAEQANNPNITRNAHLLKGIFALETEDYTTADTELRQTDQRNAYALYLLGEANEGLGNLEKAKSFYQKAATMNGANSINFAFIREKALAKIEQLSQAT